MIGFSIAFVVFATIFVIVFAVQIEYVGSQIMRLADIWESQVGEMKLSDETVSVLKRRADRDFSDVPPDQAEAYRKGLKDGETVTAQYVLGELKEED